MLIWRIWQLRRDITHGKEGVQIPVSVDFLVSYVRSIVAAQKHSTEEMLEGKMAGEESWERSRPHRTPQVLRWLAPPCNMSEGNIL